MRIDIHIDDGKRRALLAEQIAAVYGLQSCFRHSNRATIQKTNEVARMLSIV